MTSCDESRIEREHTARSWLALLARTWLHLVTRAIAAAPKGPVTEQEAPAAS